MTICFALAAENNWKASRTVPNNLNPKWNENFEFEVQMPLENSTLYMSVWDSDHQDHGHSATQLSLAGTRSYASTTKVLFKRTLSAVNA